MTESEVLQQPPGSHLYARIEQRLGLLENKFAGFRDNIAISAEKPTVIPSAIHVLPSDEYVLNGPLNVILEIYDDEVLALLPELKLYGEGDNEIEALDDLKSELLDLIEDLENTPEHKLGKDPANWKKALSLLIRKCR